VAELSGSATAAVDDAAQLALRSALATGLVAKGAEVVMLVVLVTVVPRALGPADYGVFALALSIVTIASAAASVGASPMLARFLPAAMPSERRAVARTLGVTLARRRALVTAPAVLGAGALAAVFPDTFDPVATALVAVAVGLDVAATLCAQIALGLGRYRVWSFRYPVQNGVLTAAAVVLAAAWEGTGALVAIVLASAAAFVMCAFAGAWPLRGAAADAAAPDGALEFGRHHAVSSFLLLLAHRGGLVVVALFAGARETGYAALASGLGLAALYAGHQLFLLQLATLSERADEDVGAAEQRARRLSAQALALLGAAAIAGAVALDPVLGAVFGPEFTAAKPAFIAVLALFPLIPLAALGLQLASLRLRPSAPVAASAAGLAAFLATAPPVAALWGAPGAPVSLLATTVAFVTVLSLRLPGLADRRLAPAAILCSVAAPGIALVS
jgi:stage V sporulation protein B